MKQQIKIWGTRIFALALIIFGIQQWGMPLYKQYFVPKKTAIYIPTAKVRAGEFVVSFNEIGALQAEKSVPVDAEINGKVISIVPDGQIVSAGDKLVELDTTDLQKDVRNQRLAYENALADVDRAEAELELLKKSNETDLQQAEAQLEFDENEFKLAVEDLAKKQRLADEKLIPGSQVDQAAGVKRSKELAITKGKAQLELKKKEIESKEKQKEADIRNIKFKVNMARINLEETESHSQSAMIYAPSGGLVVISEIRASDGRRKLQAGDNVNPRQTICQLPDLSSMLVKVQLGEADAPRIRTGISVLIRLEAVPDKVFHGSVEKISSLAVEASPWDAGSIPGRKNFEVIIAVKEVDPKTLKPGMTANVEFVCDTIKNAIYVPIEAVVEIEGKTYVFVKEGKQYKRTPVVTGKSNDNFICITKGLEKDQVVALRDPTRPLDAQEAGSSAPGADKDKEKKPVPIPGAD